MSGLRVGMIGCGLIGRSHGAGLRDAPGAEIVAVHDTDADRAAAFANEFSPLGLDAVKAGFEEVLAAVDAVYVCTWTSTHPELVAAAASAGLPVFCEKPLAKTMAEAADMTAAVTEAGVTNQVGLVLRHSPAFRLLRDLIQRPEVGPIMNVVFRDDQYIPTQGLYGSTWRSDSSKAGGGALLEHSIHDLDLLEWMLGPIADVSARTGSIHGLDGIDDQATVTLVSESGAQAGLVSVWHDVLTRPSQRWVEVFTLKGYFSLEGDWNGPVVYDIAETDAGPPGSGRFEGRALLKECRRLGIDGFKPDVDFVEAVRAGGAANPDFSIALAAHRLADAAYRSAGADGATIATPPVDLPGRPA
ncbi:MAG: Gfo/Idh/MocA family protein [Acidimicrobiales bacterium]